MSNKISRDYSQSCRKLFWSSLGALVPLSPYHNLSFWQTIYRGSRSMMTMGSVWFAMLSCMQVCADACTGVCKQICACSTYAVADHTVANLSLKVLPCWFYVHQLMSQTWCASKTKQHLDETFLICLCVMEQQHIKCVCKELRDLTTSANFHSRYEFAHASLESKALLK